MSTFRLVDEVLLKRWPLPNPQASESKEERGRVFVIAGSAAVPGAALLSATAALRSGAGKLQIATHANAATSLGLHLPEAKVITLPETASWGAPMAYVGEAVSAADALLIGPGIEDEANLHRLERGLPRTSQQITVLDAGALTPLIRSLVFETPTILTPHFREMANLLDVELSEVEAQPAQMAMNLAKTTGAVVVLKSPNTYIASPDGSGWVHQGGIPGLGTSGSGDVLAGMMVGLAARGASPQQAAVWAVAIHAQAGLVLSKKIGPVGFLARELLDEVPMLLHLNSSG